MRAAQITRFGDWQAVKVADVPVPVPRASEVLVRVAASSINSVDVSHREGQLKILTGRRIPQGLGIDLVGTVESVGTAVRGFSPGERVWGIRAGASGMKNETGLTADFAVVDARRLSRAPESLGDVEAASLVVGGYTALRALKDVARLQPGERVLIRGGTGGVGSAAIQIAAALGARVAVLASASTDRIVRDLGAIDFFDYSTATPASVGKVDVLMDTVGTGLLSWRRTLAPNGRMVGVAFDSLAGLASIGVSSVFASRRIQTFAGQPPAGSLEALGEFLDANGIRGLVHAIYPIEEIAEAHRVFSAGRVRGKIVITAAS
ncbi:quinone oxidoreductase family protein [Arthrobacter cryoconiti]|uniref:Zinc-binding alcohol dehydrogenase family protein n=1 Tax=Arthrobacter cryoconiti TaxID=748907 RepID=A0ABV8R2B7_9MICC|nr:NAD(P)-dependent alcohol dehydrogenase [Arthrobacter cryoconiti]MCC9067893.1 NAD(P)-dependent alcohol dehydrogenase [Arthrobacter cryoconiti]